MNNNKNFKIFRSAAGSGKTYTLVKEYIKRNPTKLLPRNNVQIIKDNDYIMASVGVLSLKYPDVAFELLKKSLRIKRYF